MRRITLFSIFMLAAMLFGCGSKKSKAKTGDDAEGTDAGASDVSVAGMEPEANTGPADYPEPPKRNAADRNPVKFDVSVTKAYVLPLSEDGACFDQCTKEVKTTFVDALPGMAGEQFASAAKALTTAVGAKGGKDALPDIYVHVDCGSGQTLTTHKTSAENRLVATWKGGGESLMLDAKDQCAVSVWDADSEGDDELIGDTLSPAVDQADQGIMVITSDSNDFGQVYLVELSFEQLEGESVWKEPETSTGGSASSGGSTSSGTGSGSASSGSTGSATPVPPGATLYSIEIVKANLKAKKKSGEAWDTKLPFVGKAGDEAPDPFCEAYVNGHQSPAPFMKTESMENTNYVEWRASGEGALKTGDKVHFMVRDKDKLDHDMMGECITDPIEKIKLGQNITIRDCGQVDFLVFKITRK